MSADAIYRISTALRDNLAAGLRDGPPPGTGPAVQLVAPGSGTAGGNLLSLWLYQVTEDEFSRNHPPGQTARDTLRPPPLRLNLHYLLTPVFATPEQDMQELGKAMRWLHENPIVEVRIPPGSADRFADRVRISVGVSDLEGLARLWEATQQPYRLSVGYLVRTARIDPTTETTVSRVVDAAAGWTDPATAGEGGA